MQRRIIRSQVPTTQFINNESGFHDERRVLINVVQCHPTSDGVQVDHKDALQLLTNTRSKLREHVGLNTDGEEPDVDIEHCISKIQALIVVNDEIFERCMANFRAEPYQ